ncbi:hypothetical protein A2415_04800 [candidate division WWE3 bacterium RIFOXYC1_FULL_39_7]|uniref:Glycosyltransferase RgtA/B/C/D-like domain-containing protein n=2 Tax=Katanobacteria TaxID=422282 RepID=A0A1F4X6R5_UNCKA|nr:MAG: hypothetical protein A2415_04800 [candidate division WWE3 bacterium RIFOXYC1_FULL_39_7]OGC77319.1 MAG: hypothetical protein A2619_04760 [candidate division WWE3 bacterium RIFOXYD1_FULL_39_9]
MFTPKIALFAVVATFLFLLLGRGNFPINDDWLFARQVESFRNGNIIINHQIEPAFIFQGFLGYVWSQIFGLSFQSLHLLSFVVYVVSVVFLFKLLSLLTENKKLISLLVALYAFNPIVLASSVTFMTEIYFLCLIIVSLYYYQLGFQKKSDTHFLLGVLLNGAAFLVRQSAALMIPVAIYFYFAGEKKVRWKHLIVKSLAGLIFILIWVFWPRYSSTDESSRALFLEINDFVPRLQQIGYSFIYLIFFTLPLFLGDLRFFKEIVKQTKKFRQLVYIAVTALVTFVLGRHVYLLDIFPLGNVFYIEELYSKSGFRSNFSIFDNSPFKIFLIVLIIISTVGLIHTITKNRTKILGKNRKTSNFYLVNLVLQFLLLLVTKDLYDRYLLPVFVLVLIISATYAKELEFKITKLAYTGLALLIFISLALNYEYLTVQALRWDQALKIQQDSGIVLGIQLDGTYTKYFAAKKQNDFTGIGQSIPGGLEYDCYIQSYTDDGSWFLTKQLILVEKTIEKFIPNPKVYEAKKLIDDKRIKKHLKELRYNQMYFSPLYSIIGKKAYVGSWCELE